MITWPALALAGGSQWLTDLAARHSTRSRNSGRMGRRDGDAVLIPGLPEDDRGGLARSDRSPSGRPDQVSSSIYEPIFQTGSTWHLYRIYDLIITVATVYGTVSTIERFSCRRDCGTGRTMALASGRRQLHGLDQCGRDIVRSVSPGSSIRCGHGPPWASRPPTAIPSLSLDQPGGPDCRRADRSHVPGARQRR